MCYSESLVPSLFGGASSIPQKALVWLLLFLIALSDVLLDYRRLLEYLSRDALYLENQLRNASNPPSGSFPSDG